jgi:hypothetical protein
VPSASKNRKNVLSATFSKYGRKDSTTLFQILALLVFVAAGVLFAPLLGFEDDELIFVNIFSYPKQFSWLPLPGGHAVPVMPMSYVGALKCWLYTPLFVLSHPGVWVVRLPVLLLAAVTIALLSRLMTQIAGRITGLVITCLLATDTTFLLSATFDWGPVVLQNLLLMISLLLLCNWYWKQNDRLLFLGGLSIGLAVWDKALFFWQLAGLTSAFALIAFPVLKCSWNRKNCSLFLRGVLLGALPLIATNLRHHFATFKDNGHFVFHEIGPKAAFLLTALDGRRASDFFLDRGITSFDQIHRPLAAIGGELTQLLGPAPSSWRLWPELLIVLVGICIAKGTLRKWIAFFLVSGLVAWFQSAITLNAGHVIHHAVLIWINWYAAVSLCVTALYRSPLFYIRPVVAIIVGVLCFRGLMVVGANYGEFLKYPGNSRWTNADTALAEQLIRDGVKRLVIADWGINNVVLARSNNRFSTEKQGVPLNLGTFNASVFSSCMPQDCAVVTYPVGRTLFAAARATLEDGLRKTGLHKTKKITIYDTHGVAAFEVFRISNTPGTGPS